MPPALVTGATGFVGARLAQDLLASGRPVRLLARRPEALPEAWRASPRAEAVAGDLRDPASLRSAAAGCAAVFHCAAWLPGDDPEEAHAVNVEGTAALAEAAKGARFVHLSSTAVMGQPAGDVVDETSPCRPASPYEVTKHGAERAALAAGGVALRPPMVTGRGLRGGPLLKLFRLCRRGVFPAIGDGLKAQKPLIDVADLVRAMLLAEARGRPGEAYFVHSDGGHTLEAILCAAGRLVGRKRPWVRVPLPLARLGAAVTAPPFRWLDREPPLTPERLDLFLADRRIRIAKARADLGFEPHVQDLDAMLEATYRGFVASGRIKDG